MYAKKYNITKVGKMPSIAEGTNGEEVNADAPATISSGSPLDITEAKRVVLNIIYNLIDIGVIIPAGQIIQKLQNNTTTPLTGPRNTRPFMDDLGKVEKIIPTLPADAKRHIVKAATTYMAFRYGDSAFYTKRKEEGSITETTNILGIDSLIEGVVPDVIRNIEAVKKEALEGLRLAKLNGRSGGVLIEETFKIGIPPEITTLEEEKVTAPAPVQDPEVIKKYNAWFSEYVGNTPALVPVPVPVPVPGPEPVPTQQITQTTMERLGLTYVQPLKPRQTNAIDYTRNYSAIDGLITDLNRRGPNNVNAIYDYAERIPALESYLPIKRNRSRGWLGDKDPKSAYAKRFRSFLINWQESLGSGLTPKRDPYAEDVFRRAGAMKPSSSAVFEAFDAWRKAVIKRSNDDRGQINNACWQEIQKVRAPGWMSSSKSYISKITSLVNDYTTSTGICVPSRPVPAPVPVPATVAPPTAPQQAVAEKPIMLPWWKRRGFSAKTLKVQPPLTKNIGPNFLFGERAPAPAPAPAPVTPNSHLDEVNITPNFLKPGYLGIVDGKSVFAGTGGARRTRKIAASRRMARRNKHRTSRRRTVRRQHGGATPMPLAYYQPGAYETRTLEATGAGLAGSTATWAREPVMQTGGRWTRRGQRQAGGFSPSVMGQFANVGLRALPVAAYMGYKMFNKKSRKAGRKAGRKTGRKTRRR